MGWIFERESGVIYDRRIRAVNVRCKRRVTLVIISYSPVFALHPFPVMTILGGVEVHHTILHDGKC